MSDAVTPEADASATEADAAVAVEEAPAAAAAPAAANDADSTVRENPRKVREGMVVSVSMDKTIVVEAIDRVRHRRYAKTVQRSNKLFAHDETNDANVGGGTSNFGSITIRLRAHFIKRSTCIINFRGNFFARHVIIYRLGF